MVNALAGAVFGVTIQLFSNSLRKQPLMRRPWEHVLCAVAGGAAGSAIGQWQAGQEREWIAVLRQREQRERRKQQRKQQERSGEA